ncbi:MAG: hypothetical protein ACO1OO_16730 [Flavisolibacter sp.]
MERKTSPHILGTAANLLGFCLFVITSYHITNKAESNVMDDFTCVVGIILTFSCIFSFFSIRTMQPAKEKTFESIADYLFVTALGGVLIIILLIAFNFIS